MLESNIQYKNLLKFSINQSVFIYNDNLVDITTYSQSGDVTYTFDLKTKKLINATDNDVHFIQLSSFAYLLDKVLEVAHLIIVNNFIIGKSFIVKQSLFCEQIIYALHVADVYQIFVTTVDSNDLMYYVLFPDQVKVLSNRYPTTVLN